MKNLFSTDINFAPLAEIMRPKTLDDFFGQEKIVGKNSPIRQMIINDNISSMILWGPPGVGKTTLAKIIAHETHSSFHELSAVTSGVKEIKELIEIAKYNKLDGKKTIVFVDEIHRFNKAQQDAFLPFVEKGNIILIGATTENPSFEVNSALLSRSKVYVLESLKKEDLIAILKRVLKKEEYRHIEVSEEVLEIIASKSSGDARSALNTFENLIQLTPLKKNKKHITKENLEDLFQSKIFLYDKHGEEHYNFISALHKSMRNSDPDAALYYLARMLEAGENPLYIARRLIRFASEDIGISNPDALVQAISAYNAAHYNGMPECDVNLAQAVVYLSVSPKSNSLYVAYNKAKQDAKNTPHLKVPPHLRNAVTKLDKELGNGVGYQYAHDNEFHITSMSCMPEELKTHKYYKPSQIGREKNVSKVLKNIEERKQNRNEKY